MIIMLKMLSKFFGRTASRIPLTHRPSKLPDRVEVHAAKQYRIEKVASRRWKVIDEQGNVVFSSRTRVGATDWLTGKAILTLKEKT